MWYIGFARVVNPADKSVFGGSKVSIFTKIAEKYDWKIIGEPKVLERWLYAQDV